MCPMEQRNNLVLQGTETFSRGQLDNLALENGNNEVNMYNQF